MIEFFVEFNEPIIEIVESVFYNETIKRTVSKGEQL